MSIKTKTCMSKVVRIVSPTQTICEAARTMKTIDAGFLPIGENDRLVGTITDRDITVRAVAEGQGPDTPVRDVMTKELHYCFEDDDIETVAEQMAQLQVRRLPVLNHSKRVVGIVSLSDICRTGDCNAELSAATLSSVTTPGGQHVQK